MMGFVTWCCSLLCITIFFFSVKLVIWHCFMYAANYYIFVIILKFVHAANYFIFIVMNKHVVGRKKIKTKLKFVHVKILIKVYIVPARTRAKLHDSGIRLHGCMFPGSPLLHPDNDKWKCTMFTNKLCISAVCFVKTIYTGKLLWCTW